MHVLVDTPTSPRPCKGLLGDPPESGSTKRTSSSEDEAAVGCTPASAMPWRLVVASASLREVISLLLTQVSHGSLPSGSAEKITTVFQETQRLFCSTFPWVRVTEDREEANCLLLPTAPHQVAESLLADLEQVLVSRGQLERALSTAPHILQHHMVYLVALGVARLVPEQREANQEDLLRMESALRCLPPVATVTVSSDLVDDLLVGLILKLHPLNGDGSARGLDQQQVLALTLQLSLIILETLRKMPGVAVDTGLPRPGWNMRRLTFLVQSRLMKGFGSALQLKKLMAMGDPDLLRSIPGEIMEVLLAQYQSGSPEAAPIPTPVEEDPMEARLFSQTLREPIREQVYQEFGTWVRRSKLFRRALSPLIDQQVREYRRSLTLPGFASRAAVWVQGERLVGDDYEEVTSEVSGGTPAPNPLALGCGLEALRRQFPQAHLCLTGQCGVKGRRPELDGALEETQGGAGDAGRRSPAWSPLRPGALLLRPADPQQSGDGVRPVLTTHTPLIQRSAVQRIAAELFRDRDRTHVRSQALQVRAFEKELVEQVHLNLVKETTKYCNNRVFLRTVERLRSPQQEVQLALEVCWPLRERLSEALPSIWLTREGLREDPQVALLACSLIATEVLHHLQPSVSFGEEVKAGDGAPYCINLPVRRGAAEAERPPTLLEERLRRERQESREEFLTSDEMRSTEVKRVKGKKKWCSWLRRLFSCMKTKTHTTET